MWKSRSTSQTLSFGAMYMPCGFAEKVPSPHDEMNVPSGRQTVSGWCPLLKM